MKDLYKKNLEKINISEIQKFALDLELSIYTELIMVVLKLKTGVNSI